MSMSHLNKAIWSCRFQEMVPLNLQDKTSLIVLDECESTMKSVRECFNHGSDEMLHSVADPDYIWCYALTQSQGVGRQKKAWFSPASEGMYLSILTCRAIEYTKLNGLSLAIGTSIAKQLKIFNLSPGLKWPNDVLIRGRKISGILIETFTSKEDPSKCNVVIGVGLNIKQENFPDSLSATSIYSEIGISVDYEEVCLGIAVQISIDFAVYEREGFGSFIQQWRSLSLMRGALVKDREGHLLGRAVDIDEEGALIVEGERGNFRIVSYDEGLQFEF